MILAEAEADEEDEGLEDEEEALDAAAASAGGSVLGEMSGLYSSTACASLCCLCKPLLDETCQALLRGRFFHVACRWPKADEPQRHWFGLCETLTAVCLFPCQASSRRQAIAPGLPDSGLSPQRGRQCQL